MFILQLSSKLKRVCYAPSVTLTANVYYKRINSWHVDLCIAKLLSDMYRMYGLYNSQVTVDL